MATNQNDTQATPTPVVATSTPTPQPTPVQTSTPQSTLLPTLNASDVYSPINVKQVLTGSTSSYKNMKLSKLEKKIANANSTAELNAINIKNQPVALGVSTGQVAHQNALDTARINSVTGLYNAKLEDQKRKDAKNQKFLETYGADPSQRPKGMSRNEFAKALSAGQFSNLLTVDYKKKQAELKNAQRIASGAGSGTATERQGKAMTSAENTLFNSKGKDGFVDPNVYTTERQKYVNSGGTYAKFDAQFASQLSPQEQENLKISGGAVSDSAIEIAAQTYLTTGQMPSVGMNNAGLRTEILNRAGELAAEQGLTAQDILSGRAQYKASSTSLNNLQKYTDQVLSFEQTASSNLDLAQSLSDKVDRTGSPLINKYQLYVTGQLQGDPDTLAFMAAVQTATNEYAKVVTGQTSGAGVSDAARKETESMLNAAYDPEAFKRIVETMKKEMANRRSGLTGQLQNIQSNLFIGGTPQTESGLSDEQAYQIYLNMLNNK